MLSRARISASEAAGASGLQQLAAAEAKAQAQAAAKAEVAAAQKKDEEFEEIPDFDSQLANYEVLSWDLSPGDCIAFNFLTVHGAPGNSSKISRRRAFAARFTGDDVRYIRRKGEMSPPFPDVQLEEGQPIDCATFPQIFKR